MLADHEQTPGGKQPHEGGRSRFYRSAVKKLIIVGIVICLWYGFIRGVDFLRFEAGTHFCRHNLRLISQALQNYHAAHGTFPPAYLADSAGRPMHSWRVLLLPYFDDETADAIYEQYDFNEPWDGPHNSLLLDAMYPVYLCPWSNKRNSYVAVTGPGLVFEGTHATSLAEITDADFSDVVMIVEVDRWEHPWMAPYDLKLEEMSQQIDDQDTPLAISGRHFWGPSVLLSTGEPGQMPRQTDFVKLKALLTKAGGERVHLWKEYWPYWHANE